MAKMHPNSLANLKPPWKAGERPDGAGRRKGLDAMLLELWDARELAGQPVPGGMTAGQYATEAEFARAIKEGGQAYWRIAERLFGTRGEVDLGEGRTVVFEIVSNYRETQPPEVEASGENMQQETREQIDESP
jgi:hypothetical protein